ncbi:DNA/RNA non-specific endonuclease [Endozoicomonas arenosclerae]|uniref:DNA/RNA non-specific endonuclease n=1 Tax=Endozoicomonas arenosclerae TaxID=1633495 RepID=UPI00078399A2|nr:DNA/RNA non-specific endonuclease [Endozoicomonas arenosclerae]
MFGRNQAFNRIQIHLVSKEGDQFVLTDEPYYFHHEPLNFLSEDEAWDFLFNLQLGQSFELEDKLKGHPLLKSYHHSPTSFLTRDALYRGHLNVFIVYRNPSRHLQKIETLYDQIKVKLGQIIASEKAEAAVINQQYQALDTGGKVQAHTNRFGQGVKQSVASLLTWMGEVHDVVSKVKQRGRVYEAYLKTQTHDSVIDWYREFNEHWREAEYKEIVDVLGFDPRKISSEDFTQAWTVANILWEDDRCQALLTRFAKDYARAQHSLEISELAGSGAFEILQTLVLAAFTAGTGALVNITSKARLARQMTVLGELFSELAGLKKTVQKHTPKQTLRTCSSGDMTKDLPEDDRPAPKNNPPPKGPEKEPKDESTSNTPEDVIVLEPGEKGSWNKALNGELKPNHKYQVGPYLYETDDNGRVNRVSGELDLTKRDRNTYQQGKAGKAEGIKDGLTDDDGGHLIASIFDGPGEQINYLPMNSNLNRGGWKRMENKWAEALKDDPPDNPKKIVKVNIEAIYDGDDKRPEAFEVEYWIDGELFEATFENQSSG